MIQNSKVPGFPGTSLATSTYCQPWVSLMSQHVLTESPCAFISSKFAYLPPCAGMEASSVHYLPLAGFYLHVLGDFPFGTYRASFCCFF